MRHKAAENEFTVRFREYHGTTVVKNITGLNRLDCWVSFTGNKCYESSRKSSLLAEVIKETASEIWIEFGSQENHDSLGIPEHV